MSDLEMIDLDVAILGGGFAGIYCAKALRKRLGRRPGIKMGLIAEQNYMAFQPMLPEVVGGGLSPSHVINPIRLLCRGFEIYKAQVDQVDLEERVLRMNAGQYSPSVQVRFEHLVLALGAEIDLRRVPGMPEHALLMQNVGDAMKLHSVVLSRCEEANLESRPHAKRSLLTFVVVGGGYSGTETAGQIMDMLHSIKKFNKRIEHSDYKVVLIHSGPRILPSLSEKLSRYAEKKLRKAGLHILLGQRVKAVTSNQVYLESGRRIDANTVVCTIGNAPHRLVSSMCEHYGIGNEKGRITTLDTLQVPGHEDLWAAGDCATVPMQDGRPCPATAQFAMRQGTVCGQNIANVFDGRPLKSFTFTGLGELATIGKRSAVAKIGRIKLSGFIAWWMWRTVYLSKLPGLERKIRVMLDWSLDLFFPRDFNLLNPESTKIVTNIHLEPGDRLFNAGETPFSLYFVTSGRIDLLDQGRVVKSVGPGEYFGERALTKRLPYIYDAVAAEPTELTSLDRIVFLSLVDQSVVLKRMFNRTATQYKTTEEIERLVERLPASVAARTAGELMQTDLVTLQADTPLKEAVPQIKAHRHSSYPIVDAERRYTGTISREDLFVALKSSNISLDTPVSELGTRRLPVVDADTPAPALIETMLTHGCNKLLVQDADERLAGIVTLLDLVCESAAESSEEAPAPPGPPGEDHPESNI